MGDIICLSQLALHCHSESDSLVLSCVCLHGANYSAQMHDYVNEREIFGCGHNWLGNEPVIRQHCALSGRIARDVELEIKQSVLPEYYSRNIFLCILLPTRKDFTLLWLLKNEIQIELHYRALGPWQCKRIATSKWCTPYTVRLQLTRPN